MKKTLMRLAVVALPMLIAACGGDDLFGTLDSGTSSGTCPAGTTVFQIKDATYPAVSGSASILMDGCNTGVMASQLETNRTIKNDGQGNISLFSSDNTTLVGTGPVRCNASTLAYGPTSISDGVCRFDATYSTDLVVTANNTFTMTVTQTRANTMSETGQVCTQPASCTVKYTVKQQLN